MYHTTPSLAAGGAIPFENWRSLPIAARTHAANQLSARDGCPVEDAIKAGDSGPTMVHRGIVPFEHRRSP